MFPTNEIASRKIIHNDSRRQDLLSGAKEIKKSAVATAARVQVADTQSW